ncbi:holotricin-3-like [Penaeus indicus]|uniref:holotricin-3-like n=1 Tax=Penaeus indicus TaxID=29960 RepID=UPI00300D9CD3
MARNVAVTSLLVALCLVAAVAGHSTYGIGGHRPVVHGSGLLGGVHGGVHGGVLGGGHSGVLGGVHGGSVHGVGLVGSGIHGAGSFNTAHYPGLVPGHSFYDQRPVLGYNTCKYWCKSSYTNKYYCCQQPYQG